jgi:hypothetical protein
MHVVVFCADRALLMRAMDHLRRIGVHPEGCTTIAEIGALAERADVLFLFAAGADASALLHAATAIERWRSGPFMIVVSDGELEWTPSLPRERPAIRVPLDFLEWPLAQLEPSGPELPFTD